MRFAQSLLVHLKVDRSGIIVEKDDEMNKMRKISKQIKKRKFKEIVNLLFKTFFLNKTASNRQFGCLLIC